MEAYLDYIRFGILTVSDTCSQSKAEDTSGNNLVQIINKLSAAGSSLSVVARDCVPDDCETIMKVLTQWSDVTKLDIILTTGGTGFSYRDVTPEATRRVLDKEAPGLATAMLIESLKSTKFAMLSRAVCGIRKNTLIINLPGSKKGSEECFYAVWSCLPHAVSLLKNKTDVIKKEHSVIQGASGDNRSVHISGHNHSHRHNHKHNYGHGDDPNTLNNIGQDLKSKTDISRVARRQRQQLAFPMIDLDAAISMVIRHAGLPEIDKVDLRKEDSRLNIIGRILAENVFATEPFPPFPASTKDGYAVIASDGVGPRKVVGDRVAGSSPDLHLQGERICVRVNTGAPVPQGMDAVVQVEDTELIEEADDGCTEVSINILTEPVVGQDIRPIGCDIARGQCVMEMKTVITSTELGLFATLGINEVSVHKLPKIGILSTGDELTDPWSKDGPKPGCIRDSNKITLMQLMRENGFEAIDCGIALDNPDDVYRKMALALKKVDVLITSGSVSMGERDVIKSVLENDLAAKIHFGRVNMKPGKPVTFATCKGDGKDKLVFALPGNPSSAVVTCHIFVLPALRKLAGKKIIFSDKVIVKLKEKVVLDSRPELMRAVLSLTPVKPLGGDQMPKSTCSKPNVEDCNYTITASTTGGQLSSRLASLKGANGLLCLPQRTAELQCIEAGSSVYSYIIGKLSTAEML